jgi:hypothetical protein
MDRRGTPEDEEEHERPAPKSGPTSRLAPRQSQQDRKPEPIGTRMPVSLETISERQALPLLAQAVELAAKLEQQADAFMVQQLAAQTIRETLSGGAAAGLRLGALCDTARIGRSHLDEHLNDEWRDLAALTVHGVFAQAGRRVLYEELRSVPERVGRRHHGLGSDQHPGCTRTRVMLVRSLSASDRHCPVAAIPLTTGTRWDATCERGQQLPASDASSGEQRSPQTLAQHVDALLDDAQRVRRTYNTAVENRDARLLGEKQLDALGFTFTNRFVIPPLACGAPIEPRRDQAEIRYPGQDPQVVTVLARRGANAVLACGLHDPQAALSAHGFHPLRVNGANGPTALRVTDLPDCTPLGITSPWGLEHFYDPAHRRIARRLTTHGGSRTEVWQLVRFENDIPAALALIERHAQCNWMGDCLRRFIRDCAPGKLKVHAPHTFAGVLALMIAANAAIVDADRRAQAGVEFP